MPSVHVILLHAIALLNIIGQSCSVSHQEITNKETMDEQRIVTVMGKALEPGGVASEELVDRCRTAARVMREVEGALVIPTGEQGLITEQTKQNIA